MLNQVSAGSESDNSIGKHVMNAFFLQLNYSGRGERTNSQNGPEPSREGESPAGARRWQNEVAKLVGYLVL